MRKKLIAGTVLLVLVSLFMSILLYGQEETPFKEEKPQTQGMTFWQTMVAGGPTMIPLGLCSIGMVALIVELFLTLNQKKFFPKEAVKKLRAFVEANQLNEAYQFCLKNPSLLTDILKNGLEKVNTRQESVIKEAMQEIGLREAEKLQEPNNYLSVIAVISPMLGLMGTVTGMIKSFNAIAFAGALGKPTLLASGISEALITTAVGLFIGIPAMTLHLYFKQRTRKLLVKVEETCMDVVKIVLEKNQ